MKTLTSVEFFRLLYIVDSMLNYKLITQDEADAFIAKTGYVKISDTEYHAPDGTVHETNGSK